MAVLRSTTTVGTETGETVSVLVENFGDAQNAFTLYDPNITDSRGYLRVVRDNPDGGKVGLMGWGAGTRALFLTGTVNGQPTGRLTPVVALVPNGKSSKSNPLISTILESAVDPILRYFPDQKRYVLYYWVNVWSPPPKQRIPDSPTLFNGVRPPEPTLVDSDYLVSTRYQGPQPESRFTTIRNVPDWYQPGQAPVAPLDLDVYKVTIPPMTTFPERVGPVDLRRFWVAPFTDAHLFRFPRNYDPFPLPPKQDPYIPSGPPSPPPSQVMTEPSSDLLGNFPFLKYPFNRTVQVVNSILFSIKNNVTLRALERSTLDTYVYALNRLAGLARCSRVLMQTEGQVVMARKRDDSDLMTSATTPVVNPISSDVDSYLVVNHPRPVLALPRGINKVLLGRPKVTSYLGENFFVTAALTYRYPAAATVSLCAGNPQVDFLIQCPSDKFDEYRRMGTLPESTSAQHSPYDPGKTFTIPGIYGVSLVEVLSTMPYW